MKALGIDIGSLTTKVVVLGDEGVLSARVTLSGEDAGANARATIEEALEEAGISGDGLSIVSTGIGAKSLPNGQQKAITTCLARGVSYLYPSARMAIDIGGETETIIRINERGRLSDWVNHDKCAAGTGIFLQQMAKLMQMTLPEMALLSLEAKGRADISGTCAVFAESEVISHVHRAPPTPKADIVAGIYYSMVTRIMALCKRVGIARDVAVTGGVALNSGLVKILEDELGFKVLLPDNPQIIAALGAAILAKTSLEIGAGR